MSIFTCLSKGQHFELWEDSLLYGCTELLPGAFDYAMEYSLQCLRDYETYYSFFIMKIQTFHRLFFQLIELNTGFMKAKNEVNPVKVLGLMVQPASKINNTKGNINVNVNQLVENVKSFIIWQEEQWYRYILLHDDEPLKMEQVLYMLSTSDLSTLRDSKDPLYPYLWNNF